jgi:hypothetical protein
VKYQFVVTGLDAVVGTVLIFDNVIIVVGISTAGVIVIGGFIIAGAISNTDF